MTEVRVTVPGSVERVFAVLADGWSYGHWVVGSTHMRDVDRGWPQVGTKIHHSVGAWPLLVQDTTTVLAVDPPRALELEAGLGLFGAAWIRLELRQIEATSTEVRMLEKVSRGPGRLLPDLVQAGALKPRNRESLARLTDLVVASYSETRSSS